MHSFYETRLQLDLNSGEVKTVIWATGFRPDYSWLDVPVVAGESGAAGLAAPGSCSL